MVRGRKYVQSIGFASCPSGRPPLSGLALLSLLNLCLPVLFGTYLTQRATALRTRQLRHTRRACTGGAERAVGASAYFLTRC